MKPRTVQLLSVLATLPAWVAGIGFCFHTSFDPDVLGKYGWRYFLFLCAWFLVTIPLSYAAGRFVFGTQTIRLSRGRTVPVRPRTKIACIIAAGVPIVFLSDGFLRWRLTQATATIHTDAFHPFLQNTPKTGRGRYHVNNWGFRGEPISRGKSAGTYRIMMLGGSTVFCGDVDWEDTHCRILERELRAAYPDRAIEVQNAGTDWHSSAHSLHKLLMYVQSFDPDMIIVYHGINDLLRSLSPDRFADGLYRIDYGHYYGPVANYVNPRGALSDVMGMYLGFWCSDFRADRVRVLGPDGEGVKGANVMFFPKAEPVDISKWPSLAVFRRNMRDFVEIAHSKDIKVILASQPFLYRSDLGEHERSVLWFAASHHADGTKPSLASMINGMEQFNEASARIARRTDARFVDLEPLLPKDLEHFYDDVHYTQAGNAIVARAFLEEILAWGVIEETAPSSTVLTE